MQISTSGFPAGIHRAHAPQHDVTNKNNLIENSKKQDNSDLSKLESSNRPEKKQSELSQEEQTAVQKLKNRDKEVRTHEQAHLSAAGSIAIGGASFSYTSGPDGERYAVGGEVNIDTTSIPGDPAATLRKADVIRRAALAPASPSAQDKSVASSASSMAAKARAELAQQQDSSSISNAANKETEQQARIKNPINADITGTLINISV